MLLYKQNLKANARSLRSNQTKAEALLWSRLRRKQLKKVQFYRQRALGPYIVDFYAPTAKLIVEVDGGQHFEEKHIELDKNRDKYFESLSIKVLRFDNLQVLRSINNVIEAIFHELC